MGTSYGNWLPSMNLSFEIMPDTFIRIAAAKTITRSRLDQMTANQNITVNPLSCTDTNGDQIPDTVIGFNPPQLVCFNLGGGNPFLQPYSSTSYDISFEKYFSPGSAIIVAAFHKDLSDWIIDFSELVDLTQSIENAGFGNILTTAPEIATGVFNGPVNFADGKITGVDDPSGILSAADQTRLNDRVVPTLAVEYYLSDAVSLETICCLTPHTVSGSAGPIDGAGAARPQGTSAAGIPCLPRSAAAPRRWVVR